MAPPHGTSTAAPFVHEYLIADDERGDSAAQTQLLDYLAAVLGWLYGAAGWYVARALTFSHRAIRNSQQMISPDIAVFKEIPLTAEEQWELTSWDMRAGSRPCPPLVIEVSSASTWRTDIGEGAAHKPSLYGRMGVRAYLAYDPNRRPVWRGVAGRRLLGWRYRATGEPVALVPDARGGLWSAELESWVVPDGALLRVYDAQGVLRLTDAEAARGARRAAEERLAAARRTLREHGIDPDSL